MDKGLTYLFYNWQGVNFLVTPVFTEPVHYASISRKKTLLNVAGIFSI